MRRGEQDGAAPPAAKQGGKAPRRRAPRQVRPVIDWHFADPSDIDAVDSAEITQLSEGDLEQCGEVGGIAGMQFTPRYYRRNLPCSDDDISSFAAEFGVDDITALRDTLVIVAMEIDQVGPKQGWVMKWRDTAWAVPESYAAAHAQAVGHVDALLKLASGPFWPVALDKVPERARRALTAYRRWLTEFEFVHRSPPRGQPPLEKEQAAAYVLAWAWPILTDEEPFVLQTQNDEKRPGKEQERLPSPFNAAFLRLCHLFGLRWQISSKALAGWLADTAAQRAEDHAELIRRLGTD
jgi:hypothetical protein